MKAKGKVRYAMRWKTLRLLVLLAGCAVRFVVAQVSDKTEPSSALSPGAAYDQAMLPVEVVHRSLSNWSDAETSALAAAIGKASQACAARDAKAFHGTDLLDLARLCALGQQWPKVLEASTLFLNVPGYAASRTDLADNAMRVRALGYKLDAALNLADVATAVDAGNALLDERLYTPVIQQYTDELIQYLQLIETGKALDLAGRRLDRILPTMKVSGLPVVPGETIDKVNPATQASDKIKLFTTASLYRAALVAPTLLQLNNSPEGAAATIATIDVAVPPHLSSDDAYDVELARRQYNLLGSLLPSIPATAPIAGSVVRRISEPGQTTILFVFPEWCAQCVRMAAHEAQPFLLRHKNEALHFVSLLAAAGSMKPAEAAPVRPSPTAPPAGVVNTLRGTPTMVVSSSTPIAVFASNDFPLLVVTDHEGRIRYVGRTPDNAFIEGGFIDQLLVRVQGLWGEQVSRRNSESQELRGRLKIYRSQLALLRRVFMLPIPD